MTSIANYFSPTRVEQSSGRRSFIAAGALGVRQVILRTHRLAGIEQFLRDAVTEMDGNECTNRIDIIGKIALALQEPPADVGAWTERIVVRLREERIPSAGIELVRDRIGQCRSLEEINRFKEDLISLKVPPIIKPNRGNKGPTLLINLPESFVLKWTGWNEVLMNHLYRVFSLAPESQYSIGFQVPQVLGIDLVNERMLRSDGMAIGFDHCEEIQNCLQDIKRYSVSRSAAQQASSYVMCSEKVPGAHLLDFARSKYVTLSPAQKMKLLERIMRIALLDIVVGNIDRIIQVDELEDRYELADFEVNLGNVMIVMREGGEPLPYAIDNGADAQLVESFEKRQQYIAFLTSIFSRGDWSRVLAENITASMQAALRTQIDECDLESMNRSMIVTQLEAFSSDIESVDGQAAIQRGLLTMVRMLKTHLLPAWGDGRMDVVKTSMRQCEPLLLSALNERFQYFIDARIGERG